MINQPADKPDNAPERDERRPATIIELISSILGGRRRTANFAIILATLTFAVLLSGCLVAFAIIGITWNTSRTWSVPIVAACPVTIWVFYFFLRYIRRRRITQHSRFDEPSVGSSG